MLLADGGSIEELAPRGGPLLGVCVGREFEAGRRWLRPGDTLILYTDGLTESPSPTFELFGEDRLKAALCSTEPIPLPALRDRILGRMTAHNAGAGLADDLTLLIVRRAG